MPKRGPSLWSTVVPGESVGDFVRVSLLEDVAESVAVIECTEMAKGGDGVPLDNGVRSSVRMPLSEFRRLVLHLAVWPGVCDE